MMLRFWLPREAGFGPLAFGIILAIAFTTTAAHAATLNVVGGELVGASGVDVDGALYDVEFRSGTCAQWFDGCDSLADFPFADSDEGIAASQALLDQVLINAGPLGSFDSEPPLTSGCGVTDSRVCFVLTPFEFRDPVGLIFKTAINRPDQETDQVISLGLSAVGPFTDPGDGFTYAVWSPTPLPVPGPGLLVGAGLLALGIWKLRSR